MRFYIYCDKDGKLQTFTKDLRAAVDVADDSIEIAQDLILSQSTEIKRETVYGPFEHSYHTREKDNLY